MTTGYLIIIYSTGALVAAFVAIRICDPEYRWYHVGHWLLGVTLTITVGLLAYMLSEVAQCSQAVDPESEMDFSRCSPRLVSWYLVTTRWQQGIGAGVGLLGLGWATQLNAARRT